MYHEAQRHGLISQNVWIELFQKVNSPSKSSTFKSEFELPFLVQSLGFSVEVLGFGVYGLWFMVYDVGLRVEG